jgi:hypothetical protein
MNKRIVVGAPHGSSNQTALSFNGEMGNGRGPTVA